MSPSKKITIRVNPSRAKLVIRAREKRHYVCANCRNQYVSFFYFCPQCLGVVASSIKDFASLEIIDIQQERAADLAQTLKGLSGQDDFDFEKAFHSLPWMMIQKTDTAVLEEWKQALEALSAKVEITPAEISTKKKNRRMRQPLFPADAPLPFYFSAGLTRGMRMISTNIQNASVRLQWIGMVLAAFQLLERFYKQSPNLRILFPDYLYNIDMELQETVHLFQSPRKIEEERLLEAIAKLKDLFSGMESEIRTVTDQIQEQL